MELTSTYYNTPNILFLKHLQNNRSIVSLRFQQNKQSSFKTNGSSPRIIIADKGGKSTGNGRAGRYGTIGDVNSAAFIQSLGGKVIYKINGKV